jgi:hypothetical protein
MDRKAGPSHSPDLRFRDYFLWGNPQNVMYASAMDAGKEQLQRVQKWLYLGPQYSWHFLWRVRPSMRRRAEHTWYCKVNILSIYHNPNNSYLLSLECHKDRFLLA